MKESEEGDQLIKGTTPLDELQPHVHLGAVVQNVGPSASGARGADVAVDGQ
jgi:hypothetical protein